MKAISGPGILTGKTAAECLQRMPVLRGWNGSSEIPDWMTVGSGRKLQAVEEFLDLHNMESMDIEAQWARWAELLTLEFVQFVRNTTFIQYKCPKCLTNI